MENKFKEEKRRYYKNEELIEYDLPHCLDFFVWFGRTGVKSEYELTKKFELAFAESPNIAVRMMFFLGHYKGDKESFRLLLKHLAINHPHNVSKILRFIPVYGSVDDLLILLDTPAEKALGKFLRKRLFIDQNNLRNEIRTLIYFEKYCGRYCKNNNYSLSNIACWLPIPESEIIEECENAKKIAKLLNMDLRGYQHMIQRMRDKIIRQTVRGINYISLDYSRSPQSVNKKFGVSPLGNVLGKGNSVLENFYKKTALPPNKTTAYNSMICDLVQKVVDNKNLSAEAVSYLNYIWDNFSGFASNKKTITAV